MSSGNDREHVRFGVALASAVGQVGCVTVVVILGAILIGLVLDDALDTRPVFTLLLVLASIPLSLYLLVRIALSAAAQVTPPKSKRTGIQSLAEEGSPAGEELPVQEE